MWGQAPGRSTGRLQEGPVVRQEDRGEGQGGAFLGES